MLSVKTKEAKPYILFSLHNQQQNILQYFKKEV